MVPCSLWSMAAKSATWQGQLMQHGDSPIGARPLAVAVAALIMLVAAAPARAGCARSVTLYSASWCPYCKQVRAILARNHIKYSLLDATTAPVQEVMRKLFGDTSVPRTVIGGVVIEGVDEDRIKELCTERQIDHAPLPPMIDIKLPESPPSRHNGGTLGSVAVAPFLVSAAP